MVVPAGRTVQLYLESQDVIHAFYVPQFLFKRDVVPGRTNVFEFTVKAEDAGRRSAASAPSCAAPATG